MECTSSVSYKSEVGGSIARCQGKLIDTQTESNMAQTQEVLQNIANHNNMLLLHSK